MLEKINFHVFIIAFAIGILYCYLITPTPDVIIKFPTPYNQDIIYKDKTDTCYKYKAEKKECPLDKNKIKAQPINEDFLNLKLLGQSNVIKVDNEIIPENGWGDSVF